MKFARDILNKLPSSDKKTVASIIESLDYIQEQLQHRDQATESPARESKQKAGLPRSPKASATPPARKNLVKRKRTRRPKLRGKR
jgi:hypothetical protein